MDAEREVVDYLNGAGVGATAYYDVPADRPESFVVVERTGGPRTDIVVERPMLDVQCWAQTRRDAALLADSALDALRARDAAPHAAADLGPEENHSGGDGHVDVGDRGLCRDRRGDGGESTAETLEDLRPDDLRI